MDNSRTLTFATAVMLAVILTVPTVAGSSSLQFPSFPPPRVKPTDALRSQSNRALVLLASSPSRGAPPVASMPALRAVLELAEPPPVGLVEFARAFYLVIGEPEMPAMFAPPVRVNLYNGNTRESGTFTITRDGRVSDDEMKALKHLFRCRRTGRRHKIHPGSVRILADLAAHYPGRTIEIVSAYRAPPYGVKNSKHFHGRAIDLRVQGVKITEVRDYLWSRHDHVGVGYYRGQNFVHVDYRPRDKKMAWTSRRPGAAYHYHPKWSRVADNSAGREYRIGAKRRCGRATRALVRASGGLAQQCH